MNENWIIKIIDKGYTPERDVFIYRKRFDGKGEILRGDIITTFDEREAIKPSIILSPEALQAFANALDEIGIKPQQGFLEGKLEGTEKHLEDMRKLVFKTP